jgi:predicted signal transduction protein with EAL and GGDEF domain
MRAGASDYLLTNYSEAALMARLNAAQRVVALQGAVRAERESVIRSSGDWARSNRRLLREAHTDPLTRLYNRRYGMDRFAQEWSFSLHSATPLSCLMLDIDYFKRINDRHGHDVGDLVLTRWPAWWRTAAARTTWCSATAARNSASSAPTPPWRTPRNWPSASCGRRGKRISAGRASPSRSPSASA